MDDDEADDFAFAQAKVVRQDQLFWQIGFVVIAVMRAANDDLIVAIGDVVDFDRYVIANNLLLGSLRQRCEHAMSSLRSTLDTLRASWRRLGLPLLRCGVCSSHQAQTRR